MIGIINSQNATVTRKYFSPDVITVNIDFDPALSK